MAGAIGATPPTGRIGDARHIGESVYETAPTGVGRNRPGSAESSSKYRGSSIPARTKAWLSHRASCRWRKKGADDGIPSGGVGANEGTGSGDLDTATSPFGTSRSGILNCGRWRRSPAA